MPFVLIRHAQPEWDRDGRAVDNPGLTAIGRRQAALVGERFAGVNFDDLLVSPLQRARETLTPVEAASGTAPSEQPWMAEISNPEWEGAPTDHVLAVFAEARNRPLADIWDGLDGGESFHAFYDRVTMGARGYLASIGIHPSSEHPGLWRIDDPDREIALVAHGGTNAVLIGYLLGVPPVPWDWERFVSWHASVTRIEPVQIAGEWAFSLRRFSDLSHLPDELHTV